MCWWMLLIGLFTGAAIGLFVTCIVVAGRKADDAMDKIYKKEGTKREIGVDWGIEYRKEEDEVLLNTAEQVLSDRQDEINQALKR